MGFFRFRKTFPRQPKFGFGNEQTHIIVRKHPSVIGIPFLIIIIGASFALTPFAQARYDYHEAKTKQVRGAL